MAPTSVSQRDVFRSIATTQYLDWPAYDSAPLYDQSSLTALTEDFRTVSGIWFEHNAHDSVEGFVCQYPLTYVEFSPHDQYSGPTRYGMPQLFRAFLLKEIHGGATRQRSSNISGSTQKSVARSGLTPFPTSRHSGAVGTSASAPISVRQLRERLGGTSSKPKTRVLLSRANKSDTFYLAVTKRTNRTQTIELSSTKRHRLWTTSAALQETAISIL
jgi:hypothetical protein